MPVPIVYPDACADAAHHLLTAVLALGALSCARFVRDGRGHARMYTGSA